MHIEKSRKNVFKAICRLRIPNYSLGQIKDIFFDMNADYNEKIVTEDNIFNVVFESVKYEFRGAPNSFLEMIYEKEMGKAITVIGKFKSLLPCPCCGAKSLTEEYCAQEGTGYDICGHCNWEDDGTITKDIRSGVNRGTMHEYLGRLKSSEGKSCTLRWEFP